MIHGHMTPLKRTDFSVFFPSEMHRPGYADDQPAPFHKVVIKVRVLLLSTGA